ncbi:MAG: CHASE domain-containing protein [Verrucomicrobia bacterium]|nr:CHASE domain-containing protein [Verrucomicrobiota bacterium]
MTIPKLHSPFSRYTSTGIVLIGLLCSLWLYLHWRDTERRQIEIEFNRRADIRHNLIRDRAFRYEAGLHALKIDFETPGVVSRGEFQWIASEIRDRNPGLTSLAWVPVIRAAERAAVEADISHAAGHPVEFGAPDAAGRWVRTPDQPELWGVTYLEPQTGAAGGQPLGLEVHSGPVRRAIALAATKHEMVLSRAFDFSPGSPGCIMIWPVYERNGATTGRLLGFVTGALRISDFLGLFDDQHPSDTTDSLYLDQDSAGRERRVLYYRHGYTPTPPADWPDEAEFRAGFVRENSFEFGGRHWRTVYKPVPGWIDRQRTGGPLRGLFIGLGVTTLGVLLVETMRRRNATIQSEVVKRTAELTESRRQMSSLLQSLPGMAYRCRYTAGGITVVYVSEGIRSLVGLAPDDLVSGRAHFRDFIHPDDLVRVREATLAALADSRSFEIEYRVRPVEGPEKWVHSRATIVADPAGPADFIEGLAIDITAQKQAELERIALERKMLEGQKLESLGTLAGGIAHDFNNILTGILGHASLTRLSLPPDSPLLPNIDVIESSSVRAAELCRQMLAYAGKGRFVVEHVNVSQLVTKLEPLLKVSVGRKVVLRLNLAPALPSILGDPAQLRQIVMNLVNNAAEATADPGGAIEVATGVITADAGLLSRCVAGAGLAPGEYVFLDVIDQGCGIAPEFIPRIFEPFYTTKFAGRGLGLAAVLGIVRGHHGALQVTSAPGRGSTFRLLLPVDPAPPAPPPAAPPPVRGQILVVDDEESVRLVVSRMFDRLGFTVRVAANGSAGLAEFCQDPDAFNLVILDLLMPGLSGEETLVAIRKVRADVPILLISGYNEGDVLRRLASPHGALDYLCKPFNTETLGQKIRTILR